jgi:UDP-N-acetylglucosamine 2-epimerase (non-hydrolysing)
MPKKLALIVGARPNFMKAAPLMRELRRFPGQFQPLLIHTGQHYDHKLSQLFFEELGMDRPDIYLGVGSGSHAEQTAKIMIELEKVFLDQRPDLVVVFGDVNSTMAASLVAAKLQIKIAHVEAGLRSFDNGMPEEINRVVTDRISDYLFVTEPSGLKHLEQEGIAKAKVFYTGNIMIDSLVSSLAAAKKSTILDDLKLESRKYAVMTLHRPSNVDDPATLMAIINAVISVGARVPVVFPCHPRTQKELAKQNLSVSPTSGPLRLIEPLGYLDFLRLQSECLFVLTDSGGVQEETTYLQIPCVTMRENTERPVTVEIGSNILVGPNPDKVLEAVQGILDGKHKQGRIPELWDGHTADRIVKELAKLL